MLTNKHLAYMGIGIVALIAVLSVFYYISFYTSDGGRPCTDSSQCESECIAPENSKEGDITAGKCFSLKSKSGKCFRAVKNNTATSLMCVVE